MTCLGSVTEMRCGFVSLVGRPNVGKSSLTNAICGRKVSIVSDKPQTTRTRVRGILQRPDAQVIFVDTPGIHKPVTALGERVNATALESFSDVDLSVLVVDATKTFGKGDRYVADRLDMTRSAVVVNKIDRVTPGVLLKQLSAVAVLDAAAYFPVSARTGEGLDRFVEWIIERMPEGAPHFPPDVVRETPEMIWIAELVREELFNCMREEVPYSIATRVSEYEHPRVRCEIVVERESQKGMVIGKGGENLKRVGTRVRAQLDPRIFLELFVVVDEDWQHRPDRIQRLGY